MAIKKSTLDSSTTQANILFKIPTQSPIAGSKIQNSIFLKKLFFQ